MRLDGTWRSLCPSDEDFHIRPIEKTPGTPGVFSLFSLVAGVGLEPTTFGL